MGRTTPSFRIAEAQEIEEWRHFRRALPKGDRPAFDEMLNAARLYASASSAAVRTSGSTVTVPLRTSLKTVVSRRPKTQKSPGFRGFPNAPERTRTSTS